MLRDVVFFFFFKCYFQNKDLAKHMVGLKLYYNMCVFLAGIRCSEDL